MATQKKKASQPAVAIAMLKADHQRVRDLFQHYDAESNPQTKRDLAYQACRELEIHTQLEEQIFYPAVNEETDAGPALVKDSLQAHETMKHLLQALRGMPAETDMFDATFQELMHTVEQHVEEEEAAMFPLAEEEMGKELAILGEEMQELKLDMVAS